MGKEPSVKEALLRRPAAIHAGAEPADPVAVLAGVRDIYAELRAMLRRQGFVGDLSQLELLYAVFTSRLLKRPMRALVKAGSGTAARRVLDQMLRLFPKDACELRSGYSPRAIAYAWPDLTRKVLAVEEAAALSGRDGARLMQSLMSEAGPLRFDVPRSSGGSFHTHDLERQGPFALVMTTATETLPHGFETRALPIVLEETAEQTEAAIAGIAQCYAGTATADADDILRWRSFQKALAKNPPEVVVPFAPALARLFRPRGERARSDFDQLLAAVAVSAQLHRRTRGRDKAGRIIAILADYAHARRLLERPLAEASVADAPAGVAELVRHLRDHAPPLSPREPGRGAAAGGDGAALPPGLDLGELAAKMNIDRATVQRRAQKAKALGLVIDLAGGQGRACRLVAVRPGADGARLPEVADVDATMAELGLIMPEPQPRTEDDDDAAERTDGLQHDEAAKEPARPDEPAPPPRDDSLIGLIRRVSALRAARQAQRAAAEAVQAPPAAEEREEPEPEPAEPEPAEGPPPIRPPPAPRVAVLPAAPAQPAKPVPQGAVAAHGVAATPVLPPIVRCAPNPKLMNGGYPRREDQFKFRAEMERIIGKKWLGAALTPPPFALPGRDKSSARPT